MCLAVYIASDSELAFVSWDESNPKFHVSELGDHDGKVRDRFSLPQVAYVGSHLGCGCGFFRKGKEPEELPEIQSNYVALARYVDRLMSNGASCAIFSCWEGDQGEPPEVEYRIKTAELTSASFEFEEKACYEFA